MPLALYETTGFKISDQGWRTSYRPEFEMYIVLEPVGDILWRDYSRNAERLRSRADEAFAQLALQYE